MFKKVFLMLGEVDCGFVIWVRSKKYNISIDNQINEYRNELNVTKESSIEIRERKASSSATIEGLDKRRNDLLDRIDTDLNLNEENLLIEFTSNITGVSKGGGNDLYTIKEKVIKIVEDVMIEFNKEIVDALEKKMCKAKSVTIKENNR
mgnify:CR=1 FL=1